MEELEFIGKCAAGDPLARNEFVGRYSRLMYNYIYSVLNVRATPSLEQHVDDIFQEIFRLLFENKGRKLRSFQGKNGCSFASWLRQVTVNFTIDYLRKQRPGLSFDTGVDGEGNLEGVLVDEGLEAPDSLHEREQMNNLKECIEVLDSHGKYFIELHIRRGVRLEDLREHFRISRAAIDVYKTRLMSRLRDCFKSKGYVIN